MSYNFTDGYTIIGDAVHTNTTSVYDFSIDLELITVLLIIIMMCLVAQTFFAFLKYIRMVK